MNTAIAADSERAGKSDQARHRRVFLRDGRTDVFFEYVTEHFAGGGGGGKACVRSFVA
ncbi:hypothetical protein LJK88_48995 [Paenibacillus sp. P26]|nr:hypothetical protein LJK88_48995 [Paenibacillus sp. P26]